MKVRLTECPRDAMQGLTQFVSTDLKIDYIQSLMSVGFHCIDFTSFVSPKAIPQMADAHELTLAIQKTSATKLLAIVANEKGFAQAASYDKIDMIGYPLSISESFQKRNTNKDIAASYELLDRMIDYNAKQELVIYISMAFGNPYQDPWSIAICMEQVARLIDKGIQHISFADTIGTAKSDDIRLLFETSCKYYPDIEFSAHFHSRPEISIEKISTAFQSGCRNFDSALLGFGGCPFAEDHLVGNINSITLLDWLESQGIETSINSLHLEQALTKARLVFGLE